MQNRSYMTCTAGASALPGSVAFNCVAHAEYAGSFNDGQAIKVESPICRASVLSYQAP